MPDQPVTSTPKQEAGARHNSKGHDPHAHGHATNHKGHSHVPEHSSEQAMAWAFWLNLSFTLIEFVGGILTNSTAIMADAVHDLGDSLAIGMAWLLQRLGKKPSDRDFTYGYRRFSLLGAVLNGVVLICGSAWVLWTTLPRLANPQMPVVEGMMALAVLGVAVNGYAAFKLSRGKSMAERMLNWHLIEDVLGWVAVLLVAITLLFVDWPILDPLLSLGFTAFILFNVAKTLIATVRLFLQATPDRHQYQQIHHDIKQLPQVSAVHHLHLWSIDGDHHVLTAHIVLHESVDIDQQKQLKADIHAYLAAYNFEHSTIELEFADETCRDA